MLRKSFLLTAALTTTALVSLACNCVWFDTEQQIQVLFNKSDCVFIGLPIESLHPAEKPDQRFLGYDVLMKVQALKKGRMATDTVVILQDESDCARRFGPHDTLVVFGSRITRLERISRGSEGAYSKLADDGKTFRVNPGNNMFSRYQKALGLYPAVCTNQCISFTSRHRLLNTLIRAKATVAFAARPKRRSPSR